VSALSQSLHQSIRRALNIARDYQQDEATPEHLYRSKADASSIATVPSISGIDAMCNKRSCPLPSDRVVDVA
jgi:hypothetical protein